MYTENEFETPKTTSVIRFSKTAVRLNQFYFKIGILLKNLIANNDICTGIVAAHYV